MFLFVLTNWTKDEELFKKLFIFFEKFFLSEGIKKGGCFKHPPFSSLFNRNQCESPFVFLVGWHREFR